MPDATVVHWIREKYTALIEDLDERGRRRWAATEAISLGRGGIAAVAEATGMSDRTVRNGIIELRQGRTAEAGRQRKSGAGRKAREEKQPEILHALETLIEPSERGDPQSPLRWTCKSLTNLATELKQQGYQVGRTKVAGMLHQRGYSLQANRKTREGKEHPDRDGHRNRLWKLELQRLANQTGMIIEICHYPPGTSKWNKIEHRLFCHITRNWRGVPLESHEVVVNLVSSTRTTEGLEVHCSLDENEYKKGRKISDLERDTIRLRRNKFHGDWNYEILPR